MMKTLTLRDANQGFSRFIRAVEAGEDFMVTRKGMAVAKISPVSARLPTFEKQQAALAQFHRIVAEGWQLNAGRFDRNAAHER